ncbi:MAG: LysM peptidoglycan-binding domain-containing protein [Treponema sp.]|nr:LysM peptidoglycan-binding domain-containing protein [Treponema sp.]
MKRALIMIIGILLVMTVVGCKSKPPADDSGPSIGSGTGTGSTGGTGTGTGSGTGTGAGGSGDPTGVLGGGTGAGSGSATTGGTGTGSGTGTESNVSRGENGVIITGATNYTVARGDTLALIASRRYGANNMDYFPLIRLANARAISDPDVIDPGLVIIIPNLQTNLNDAQVRSTLRTEVIAQANRYDGRYPQSTARLRALANTL